MTTPHGSVESQVRELQRIANLLLGVAVLLLVYLVYLITRMVLS